MALSQRFKCPRCCPLQFPTLGDILALLLYSVLHIIVFGVYFQEYEWPPNSRKDTLMDVGVTIGHNMHVAAALHLLPVLRNSPIFYLCKRVVGAPVMSHNYQVGWHVINGYLIATLVTLHMLSFWFDWIERGTEIMNVTMSSSTSSNTEIINRPNLQDEGVDGVGGGLGTDSTSSAPTLVNIFLHNSFTSKSCWEEYGACLGEISWLSLFLLVLLSQGCVRRSCYYVFLYTHWLFFLMFYIFGCLHDPELLLWMIPSFILYFCDWLLRLGRITEIKLVEKRGEHSNNNNNNNNNNDNNYKNNNSSTSTANGRSVQSSGECATYRVKKMSTTGSKLLFPNDVSGMFIYLNVPSVSKREYHPFSLCKGTHKGTAEIIVRSHGKGSWTGNVLLEGASRVGPIPAYCSGTYGSVPHIGLNSAIAVFVAGMF